MQNRRCGQNAPRRAYSAQPCVCRSLRDCVPRPCPSSRFTPAQNAREAIFAVRFALPRRPSASRSRKHSGHWRPSRYRLSAQAPTAARVRRPAQRWSRLSSSDMGRMTDRPGHRAGRQLGQQCCPTLPCQILIRNTRVRLLGNSAFGSEVSSARAQKTSVRGLRAVCTAPRRRSGFRAQPFADRPRRHSFEPAQRECVGRDPGTGRE
jgi:hypothetical protein